MVRIKAAIGQARALHDPSTNVETDLGHLDSIFRSYQWIYKQNPVGDNEDIVAQLMGRNPKKMVLLPPDHPSVSPDGQLLDRFGTPYFFHAVSEKEMDIWSYGPDRTLGTDDDVKLHGDELYERIDPLPDDPE